MIAVLILVLSLAACVQFFLSYCRSLVTAYSEVELSAQAREMAGVTGATVPARQFGRLLRLLRLSPRHADDRLELLAVRAYYGVLTAAKALGRVAPSVMAWSDHERDACAYAVAVALDRRIADAHQSA